MLSLVCVLVLFIEFIIFFIEFVGEMCGLFTADYRSCKCLKNLKKKHKIYLFISFRFFVQQANHIMLNVLLVYLVKKILMDNHLLLIRPCKYIVSNVFMRNLHHDVMLVIDLFYRIILMKKQLESLHLIEVIMLNVIDAK